MRELEVRCQKPHWREVGSPLARHFARPLALYVTRILLRWPVSANAVTSVALVVGLTSAVLVGMQSPAAFVSGVALLHFWYLLDHVDGQVARYQRSESVTGMYLDFMMHHVVHPACAFALGYRVAGLTGELAWTLAGAGFALGMVILAVSNDCRYKAFFGRSQKERWYSLPDRPFAARMFAGEKKEWRLLHLVHSCMRKACEMPNVIVVLTPLAALTVISPSAGLGALAAYLLLMAVLAPLLGIGHLAKQVYRKLPDAELLTVRDLLDFAHDAHRNSHESTGQDFDHRISA